MIWSVYVPAASIVLFALWMLRLRIRAFVSLGRVRLEAEQVMEALDALKTSSRFSEQRERWLADMYAFLTSSKLGSDNPLQELINRLYAMSDLASPNLSAALDSIAEHEADKLEAARETPNNLLLLGIMGTVVGMILALSTFGLAGFQGDGAGIDIGRIMSAMLLAFASTGIALLLSVSTRSQLERVTLLQSDMLAALASYAFTHLAPVLLPKHDRLAQQRFHELMDRQQNLLDESLAKNAAVLTAFSDALAEAQDLTAALSTSLAENAAAVSETGQRLTGDLNAASADIAKKLLGSLQLVSKEMEQQRSSLETLYRDTKLTTAEEKRANRQQAEALQRNAAETLNLLKENNRELAAGLDAMTKHFSAHVAKQTETVEALRREVAELSARLVESQDRYQKTFLQTVESFLQHQFDELARSFRLRRRS